MNFMAKSSSSMLFPPLHSTLREKRDGKNEFICEDIDSIEALPQMIDRLHIDRNTKQNITELGRTRKRNSTYNLKKAVIPSYDIDKMSSQELHDSLCRIKDNPQQPFSFLTNILKSFTEEDSLPIDGRKLTEIDIQLAAVAKRIKSSKILLKNAKSYADDIHLHAKNHRTKSEQIICEIY